MLSINRIIQGKPGQEADNDPSVGLARVGVADGGGKEFDEAPGGPVAGALDQGRQAPGRVMTAGVWGTMSAAILDVCPFPLIGVA